MNKKVYIVTSGEYSDYGIDAVFSSKELAQKYIKLKSKINALYPDSANIEEYAIDWFPVYPSNKNHYVVIVEIETGNLLDLYLNGSNSNKDLSFAVVDFFGEERLWVYCWAKDEEHAKKIAYDTRTKVLAERIIP